MKIKMFAPLAGLISLALAGGSTYSADLPQIRTPVAAERPVLKEKALPSRPPAGSVAPDSGAWHTFVRVTAPQIASADGIRVVWFPDDDNSKPQAGAMTATVRKRIVPDEVEIEIPRNAGGAGGGVVRILAIMPKQLQPVFLARFTVLSPVQAGHSIGKLAAPPTSTESSTIMKEKEVVVSTPPLKFVGMRGATPSGAAAPRQIAAERIVMQGRWPLQAAENVTVTAGAIQMTGRWPAAMANTVVASEAIRMTGRWPLQSWANMTLTADAIRMTGRWPMALAATVITSSAIQMTGRWPAAFTPVTITTDAIRMTGRSSP